MREPAVWRYNVPGAYRDCGGTFILTEDGFFACVTDWGNYAHHWRNIGDCHFKDFLRKLDATYLASKLGSRTTWPAAQVAEHIREAILRQVTDEEQRAALLAQADGAAVNETAFALFWHDHDHLELEDLPGPTFDSDLFGFLEHLWPRFRAMLDQERDQQE